MIHVKASKIKRQTTETNDIHEWFILYSFDLGQVNLFWNNKGFKCFSVKCLDIARLEILYKYSKLKENFTKTIFWSLIMFFQDNNKFANAKKLVSISKQKSYIWLF